MSEAGVFIAWDKVAVGREKQAMTVWAEALEFYEKAQANGEIERYEIIGFQGSSSIGLLGGHQRPGQRGDDREVHGDARVPAPDAARVARRRPPPHEPVCHRWAHARGCRSVLPGGRLTPRLTLRRHSAWVRLRRCASGSRPRHSTPRGTTWWPCGSTPTRSSSSSRPGTSTTSIRSSRTRPGRASRRGRCSRRWRRRRAASASA